MASFHFGLWFELLNTHARRANFVWCWVIVQVAPDVYSNLWNLHTWMGKYQPQQCTTAVINVLGHPKWKVYSILTITQGHCFIIQTYVTDTILIPGVFVSFICSSRTLVSLLARCSITNCQLGLGWRCCRINGSCSALHYVQKTP